MIYGLCICAYRICWFISCEKKLFFSFRLTATDNAVEATEKVYNGAIDITIKETKGRFIIKISNTYDDVIKAKEKALSTTKEDKINHGLGMESVRTVVSKYDGELSFDFAENIFNTMVLLYI